MIVVYAIALNKKNKMKIGYVRVSSVDQKVDRQIEGLELEGIKVEKMFVEYASGASKERPKLQEMLSFVREGDEVIVSSIDRLGRSMVDLASILGSLKSKKVSVHFLKENLKISENENARDELILWVFGITAQFERAMIKERQKEGIKIAKEKGIYKGSAKKLTDEALENFKVRYKSGIKIKYIAKEFGLSLSGAWNYVNMLREELGYRNKQKSINLN